jgi:hypothetical protein
MMPLSLMMFLLDHESATWQFVAFLIGGPAPVITAIVLKVVSCWAMNPIYFDLPFGLPVKLHFPPPPDSWFQNQKGRK